MVRCQGGSRLPRHPTGPTSGARREQSARCPGTDRAPPVPTSSRTPSSIRHGNHAAPGADTWGLATGWFCPAGRGLQARAGRKPARLPPQGPRWANAKKSRMLRAASACVSQAQHICRRCASPSRCSVRTAQAVSGCPVSVWAESGPQGGCLLWRAGQAKRARQIMAPHVPHDDGAVACATPPRRGKTDAETPARWRWCVRVDATARTMPARMSGAVCVKGHALALGFAGLMAVAARVHC